MPSTLLSSHSLTVCGLSAVAYGLTLKYAWDARLHPTNLPLCGDGRPFAAWTHTIHLLVVGGSLGTLSIHLFKLLHTVVLPRERPATTSAMLAVFFIMALSGTSQLISLSGAFPICEDAFGFRSPAIQVRRSLSSSSPPYDSSHLLALLITPCLCSY
jgi:hypothetical protein